ncbi:sugar-binding transcriptional regulator [Antarcticirhabdus aurantiaca]|uniref:Sugar-binding transcriptional regulator n=1 Tax=Antarcticirhabdus aurantiaca TaxID=2606717 RepID=A0ACD4NM07_9HYPH|nr:sugar-binding transcriptional regulator [Antarcticirhabdus aurantiaca]WAJ27925.1 sugar-binding transcriptional regulator [Jeongeuplla avenae]
MADSRHDFETIRQIQTVLTLHFVDGLKQNEIAEALNLSASKVNRLIAQGRKLGMLKISVESPFQRLVEIEGQVREKGSLASAVVTPTVPGSPESTLQQVGRVAAGQLLETIRDGDVLAITGGKAISAIVQNLQPERAFDVTVVPLTGGVQGKHYTDVNHLAARLAEKLGGSTMLLHAPLFAETREQRDLLLEMAPVKAAFDLARRAAVVLAGIGSIRESGSSYYDLHPDRSPDRDALTASGAAAEFLAHLIRDDGKLASYALNDRLVALAPADLGRCRSVIGVASGAEKVRPIRAVLNGGYLKSLVVDEDTANALLSFNGSMRDVA